MRFDPRRWLPETTRRLRAAGAILRSWFELSPEEQQAVIIVLALFLIGLAVKACHHS